MNLLKTMLSNFWSRNFFLFGIVFILSAILVFLNIYTPKEKPLRELVIQTDQAIKSFGNSYTDFLAGKINSEGYIKAVTRFRDEINEINKPLPNINPNSSEKELLEKYKTGISLVRMVLDKNVRYLAKENPDPDLLKDEEKKMETGLNLVKEVKDTFETHDKSV
ncbi:hypothetical protein HY029_04980 [Candidatus Gottesmanbacteria bacterium]|nr:hypothetical protein [Candidatus Gottesmanbacteria bacterium]